MDYGQTLEEAKKRLQELAAQRDRIDREMQALVQIIRGAEIGTQPAEPTTPYVSTVSDAESLGVTEAVRLVLGRAQRALFPTEVRDALESMGIEGSSPKVLLVHIHNVLRRLFENEEIEQVLRDGKIAYKALTIADKLADVLRQHPLVAMFNAIPRREGQRKELSHNVTNVTPKVNNE